MFKSLIKSLESRPREATGIDIFKKCVSIITNFFDKEDKTMKLSKKVLATALVFAVCFATVSAEKIRLEPGSMTSESTKGLFGTDVDDYLDVNEWSNVKPTKVFGFLSYGREGNKDINTGIAVPIGKFYLGTFFGGQLIGWQSTKKIDKDGKATTTTKTNGQNVASGSVLFGFNNIGIMGNFSFKPKMGNQTVTDKKNKTETTDSKFQLEVALKAGFNVTGPKDMLFKTSAELALTSDVDKKTEKNDGASPKKLKITNKNVHTLHINGGVSFDFAHNGPVTQGASIALNTDWNIYPTVTSDDNTSGTRIVTRTYGRLHDVIKLNPAWQITYEPEESKVALKAKVGIPITFDFAKDPNYTTVTGVSGKAYNTARKHTTKINFAPTLAAGLTYAPISKFRFNVGVDFEVPNFGWDISKTENRKADGSAAPAGTTKTIGWAFNTATGKIGFASGFTWLITKDITLDAYWHVANNLLDGFGHKLNEGSGTNFWNTVNQIFVHKVGFLVSAKL